MKLIARDLRRPFERALEFQRRTIELIADDVRPIDAGSVVRTPSLPQVWSLNHVRVTVPLALSEIVELADAELAGLSYRDVRIEFDSAGPELEQAFRAAGWMVEREVLMALRHEPRRRADTSAVAECSGEAMLEAMRSWFAEEPPEKSSEDLRQLVEYSHRESRAREDRLFAIMDGAGRRALAITKLRSAGAIAQLEDVYTLPAARGRGYARSLLTHVTALAREGGHELTFIVADDQDWPKLLYREIGFEPIGYTRTAHREVG